MSRTMREEVADFKRASILKEAVRQFFAKGYDGTRIDEIAAVLGVTKPFIYYHFKNKTEILDEICVRATALSSETLAAVMAEQTDTFAQLDEAVRRLAIQVVDNQSEIAICFREEKYISAKARARLASNRRRYDTLLGELLARALDEGVIDTADPKIAAQTLTGAITWTFVWYRHGGRLTPGDLADSIRDLALNMLGAKVPVRAPA